MGGSWGVTLALAYSQTHPDAVSGIILRGVCMLRQEEIDWFYKEVTDTYYMCVLMESRKIIFYCHRIPDFQCNYFPGCKLTFSICLGRAAFYSQSIRTYKCNSCLLQEIDF